MKDLSVCLLLLDDACTHRLPPARVGHGYCAHISLPEGKIVSARARILPAGSGLRVVSERGGDTLHLMVKGVAAVRGQVKVSLLLQTEICPCEVLHEFWLLSQEPASQSKRQKAA